MSSVTSSLLSYVLPLRAPLTLKGVEHHERRGCLLKIEDENGNVGWGDCAPLSGFSHETIDEAMVQLHEVAQWFSKQQLSGSWADVNSDMFTAIEDLGVYPSVRYAVELAVLDLASRIIEKPLPYLLHPDPAVSLPINALITSEEGDALRERVTGLLEKGYKAFKIKVGRLSPGVDAERVRTVRDLVGKDVEIRCDANQSWSIHQATEFAEATYGYRIAYVEEPLRIPEKMSLLWIDTQLPVALDESLIGLPSLEGKSYASAVVLKPTILGGIIRTLELADEARRLGMRAVVSSAFESGVGMRGNIALAVATGGEPAGLDPYNLLEHDVLEERLPLDKSIVDIPSFFARDIQITIR